MSKTAERVRCHLYHPLSTAPLHHEHGGSARSGGIPMAYPEPIPEIKGAHAKAFLKRLDDFELSSSQKRLYRGAKEFYLKTRPKE